MAELTGESLEYCIELGNSGDLSLDEKGALVRDYSIASRCRLRLKTRRGKWVHDPNIGSRLHELRTLKQAKRKLLPYCKEALEELIAEGLVTKVELGEMVADEYTNRLEAEIFIYEPGGDERVSLGTFRMGE